MTDRTGSNKRVRLVELIDRPLGFYVLSLLIVESFIGVVAAVGRDKADVLVWGLKLGVGMFVYVTLTVTVISWFKAHVLTFDRDAHLRDRRLGPIGSEKRTVKDTAKLGTPQESKEAK